MKYFVSNLLRLLALVGSLLIGTTSFGATLISPVNGTTVPNTAPITFTWTLSGADTTNFGIRAIIYRTSDNARVADCWSGNVANSNLTTCITDITPAGANLPDGSYYWRVEKSFGGWVDITGSSNSLTIGAAAVAAAVAAIPTLSEWGIIILSALIALGTFAVLRRRPS